MVSFATKSTDIRSDLARSAGGGQWLRTVRDGKDCRVRFLQDPDEWLKYREHYGVSTKFFPCTQDSSCPGCNSEDERMKKASRRYVAQVLIVNEDGAQDVGKVVALKMPIDLANRMVNKADRNGGTLLNRDYTLIRTGNGLDTEYDAEVEDKSAIDTSKYEFVSVEAILNDMYESAWGTRESISPQEKLKQVQEQVRQHNGHTDGPVNGPKEEDDPPPF